MIEFTARRSHRAAFVMLMLTALLAAAACARISDPEGWSGGVVTDDALIIGTMEGQVLAVDKNDGSTLWGQDLGGEEESDRAVYGTPVVSDDAIFVGGYDSILYAYDRQGQEIWEEPLGGRIMGGPALAGDLLLVGSARDEPEGGREGTLYAFDASTGDEVWRFSTVGRIWSPPTVANGVVYFGTLDKTIYAVAVGLEEGRELWRFKTGGAVVAAPLIENGRVYVGAFDSVFYALDAQTGAEVWRFNGAERWYWGKAIAHEGTIFAPSLDGNLYALDADSGRLLWTFESEGAIVGSPVFVSNLLAVPVADGGESRISLVELNGSFRAACRIGDDIRTPLVADGDLIYFGVNDHSIRALRIKRNGNPDEEWVYFTNREDPIPTDRAKAC